MKALTREQVDAYRHNGFLFPISALTPEEVATCLAGLARLESDLGCAVAEADVKWRSHAYAHSPWFNDLIRHPRILDAIEDVIGPNILVWTSTFFIKEPHSPTYAAWHQDGAYFGLKPQEQVCAWVALTDASREAGCMEQLSCHGAPRTSPRRARSREQHQSCGPDDRDTVRSVEPGGDGAAGRVVLAAPRAGGAPLGTEQCVAPSGRHRPELHADPCPRGGAAPLLRDAGSRRRQLRSFRPDRPAARRT
jgi:Phytanoyl-CoA dioxygenase (PhyH)